MLTLKGYLDLTKSNNNESINTFSTSLRWAPAMAIVAGAVYIIEDIRRREERIKNEPNDKNLEELTLVQEHKDHFNQIEYARSSTGRRYAFPIAGKRHALRAGFEMKHASNNGTRLYIRISSVFRYFHYFMHSCPALDWILCHIVTEHVTRN